MRVSPLPLLRPAGRTPLCLAMRWQTHVEDDWYVLGTARMMSLCSLTWTYGILLLLLQYMPSSVGITFQLQAILESACLLSVAEMLHMSTLYTSSHGVVGRWSRQSSTPGLGSHTFLA